MNDHFYTAIAGKACGPPGKPAGHRHWTEVVSCTIGAETPVDHNTGKATGARTHKPLTLTTESGTLSSHLLHSHLCAEVLSEVLVELRRGKAEEICVQRITLTNATVSGVRFYHAGHKLGAKAPAPPILADYALRYERIEFRD